MNQASLVTAGQQLVKLMDAAHFVPKAAMWIHEDERDKWRLWIVPPPDVTDPRDFYHRLVSITVPHQDELSGLDAADVEMVPADHPAIQGLKGFARLSGLGVMRMSSNMLNGFYLPDGIILRMDV
jgi:hypothetical protein